LRLEGHHGHLRLLVRCESGDRLPQTSGRGYDWNEQSVTTDPGNGSQVREWGGFCGRGCNQTPSLSRRCTCVTGEWGGRQPRLMIHASTLSGGAGCSPPSPLYAERGTLGECLLLTPYCSPSALVSRCSA
jgi:hypothetical protein